MQELLPIVESRRPSSDLRALSGTASPSNHNDFECLPLAIQERLDTECIHSRDLSKENENAVDSPTSQCGTFTSAINPFEALMSGASNEVIPGLDCCQLARM